MNPEKNDLPTLESDSAIPLYLQVEARLKVLLSSGMFPAGGKLPTENELCEQFHVSRVTVRKALARLHEAGYIERKTGKGTYVKEKKLQRNLTSGVLSFTKMCEQLGTVASARTTRISIEEPTASDREEMNLRQGEKVLLIERIRLSDNTPVMIERDLLPEEMDFLFAEDLNHNSLYALIREKRNVVFARASRVIDIVFASAAESRMLGVKPNYPLLRIHSITQDETGEVTTVSEQLCIGDRFKLQV